MLYNVYDQNNNVIGQVEGNTSSEAWHYARRQYEMPGRIILDVRLVSGEIKPTERPGLGDAEEVIRKMRREGKGWSDVTDWITRQVGYSPDVIEWARKIYYEEEVIPKSRVAGWLHSNSAGIAYWLYDKRGLIASSEVEDTAKAIEDIITEWRISH